MDAKTRPAMDADRRILLNECDESEWTGGGSGKGASAFGSATSEDLACCTSGAEQPRELTVGLSRCDWSNPTAQARGAACSKEPAAGGDERASGRAAHVSAVGLLRLRSDRCRELIPERKRYHSQAFMKLDRSRPAVAKDEEMRRATAQDSA